jgi:WD40 repeat protein
MKATAAGKPQPQTRMLSVIRFSPDGATLYGGGLDGLVCRWELKGDVLTPMADLKGHSGWVNALAVHPDGRVFSGDSWGRLIAWKDGKPARDVGDAHAGWVRKVALSPDGKTLASCDSLGVVRLWDADTLKRTKEIAHGTDVLALAYAADGSLFFGDLKGIVVRHDGGKEVRRYEAKGLYKVDRIQDVGGVRCLALSPDGKTLAAAGSKVTTGGFVQGAGQVAYFDAATGKERQTVVFGGDSEGYVLDLYWLPSGVLMGITSGQPGSGQLFFHKPGDAAPTTGVKLANGHSLAVHPDGKRVVTWTTQRLGGNGRGNGKDYPANTTPLQVFRVG